MKATGAILAGGKSSRMKYNKAFMKIGGCPVIDIIADKFSALFEETIIITNEIELFSGLGLKAYTDIYPRMGPVSGIHSALYNARYDEVFVMGCDMPFVDINLARYLLEKLGPYDSAVPEIDGHLQPLTAAYHRRSLPVFTGCLEQNHLKLTRIFREELNALLVPRAELEAFGHIEHMFFNINDSEALAKAEEIAGGLGLLDKCAKISTSG